MNHRSGRLFVLVCLWLCAALAASQAPSSNRSGANPDDPLRKQAIEAYDRHDLPKAAPLFEQVVAKYPKDIFAHEALGVSLLGRASTYSDPAARKSERLKARQELLKARELGDNSDLCKALLAGIPGDGSEPAVSGKAEVDAAIQRGEAAFSRGNFEEAIKEYAAAYDLDPKQYYAALFVGDCYFRLKQQDKASEWFGKAIQIDPNTETAYRYWGDALMENGNMKEARAKFIQGLVAYPYAQASWAGLNGWLTKNKLAYKKVSIKLPQAPTYDAKGNSNITIDPSTLGGKSKDDNDGAAWLVYQMTRVTWHNQEFAKQYPQEKAYRHSLKEEAAALTTVATVFDELQQKQKSPNADPGLVLLSQLKADGMIEPYVLLVIPDKEIAQDFEGYQAAHRDKLIQFVSKYVVPEAP